MTAGQNLSANSTVDNVSAWEHLTNPSGTGGAGDVIIISDLITLVTEDDIIIREVDDSIMIIEEPETLIRLVDDSEKIKESDQEKLNGIC